MKLHLPCKLLAAVLACICTVGYTLADTTWDYAENETLNYSSDDQKPDIPTEGNIIKIGDGTLTLDLGKNAATSAEVNATNSSFAGDVYINEGAIRLGADDAGGSGDSWRISTNALGSEGTIHVKTGASFHLGISQNTNSTTAFNKAISLEGGRLYFDDGKYVFNKAITLTADSTIQSEWSGKTHTLKGLSAEGHQLSLTGASATFNFHGAVTAGSISVNNGSTVTFNKNNNGLTSYNVGGLTLGANSAAHLHVTQSGNTNLGDVTLGSEARLYSIDGHHTINKLTIAGTNRGILENQWGKYFTVKEIDAAEATLFVLGSNELSSAGTKIESGTLGTLHILQSNGKITGNGVTIGTVQADDGTVFHVEGAGISATIDTINLAGGAKMRLDNGNSWGTSIGKQGGTINIAATSEKAAVIAAGVYGTTTILSGIAGTGLLELRQSETGYANNVILSDIIADGPEEGNQLSIKQTSGTYTFNGANTYSGTTTLAGGTMNVGADGSIGTGDILMTGGTLKFSQNESSAIAPVDGRSVELLGGTLSTEASSWKLEGLDLSLGAVTASGSGEDKRISISGGTTTFVGTVINAMANGATLELLGDLVVGSTSELIVKESAGYSDGENGYISGDFWLVQGEEGTNLVISDKVTLDGTSLDVKSVAGSTAADGQLTTTGGAYITTSGTAYYVNSGVVNYEEGSSVASDNMTSVVLKGGSLNMSTNLNEAATDGIILHNNNSKISLGNGVSLAASKVDKGDHTLVLGGTGLFEIVNGDEGAGFLNRNGGHLRGLSNSLNLADDWTGTVAISGGTCWTLELDSLGKVVTENGVTRGVSTVELKGVSGNLQPNDRHHVNLHLVNDGDTPALKLNNGGSNSTTTFSGAISGDGTLSHSWVEGNNVTYDFTGDVSQWTGTLKTEKGAAGTRHWKFSNNPGQADGTAALVQVAIDHQDGDLLTVEFNNSNENGLKVDSKITGNVAVTYKGTAVKTVTNGESSYSGGTTIEAGEVKVSGKLGTGAVTVADEATLTYTAGDHTNAINLNGGTVNLNKSGIGKKDADKVAVTLGGDSTIQGNNAALYAAVGGTGKLTLKSDGSEFHVYSDISNEGAVELASGTINIGNGYGGAASIANQGAVDVTGATATLRNGSTITSTGDVNISAGSLAVTNGTTLDNGGDINVSGSGQLKIESGANVGSPINAGTVSLASESATAYKNLLVADGSLASLGEGAAIADATITATGNVSISDLALKGVTLEGSGEGVGFDISGTTTLGGMLTNNSTVTISGTLKADSMAGFDARGDVSYSDGDNGYVNADYTLVKAGEGSSLSIVDSILVNGTATAVKTDAATGDAYASVLGTSGAYHVNKGTVSYAAGAAVASDATTGIVLNGGTLDVTAGTNVTKAMQVNADSTIKGAAGHAGISGGITVSGEGGDLTINSLATTVSDANQHGDYFSLSGNVDLGSHDLVIGKGVVRLGNADTEKPTDAYSFTAGNIVVKDGAALEVYRNGGTINSGVTLENATLRVQQINNSGSENLQFGALTVAGDSTLSRNSWGKSANFSKLTGEGNLRATDPGTTTFGSAEGFTGKLTVEGGNVNFQTGTSFAGTLEAKGGTTTFQGETTLSNAATINGGTMKVDGTLALSGQAIVKAGEVATIGARPTVARSTADGSFTNVTVTADGISSISGKSGSVANADIDVTGDYSIGAVAVSGSTVDVTAGKLAMDGTTLTGTTLTVSANGTLTVGSATLGDGAKLVLNGVGQSAVSVTGTLTFTGTSELDLTNISLVTPTEPLTFLTNTSGLTAEMITTATGTTATVDGNGNVILSGSTPPPAGGEYLITSVVGFNNGILTFSTDMDALSDDVALNYATALWNGTNPVKDAIFKATGSYDAFYSEDGLLVQLTGPDGKTLLDLSAVTSLTINGYAGMNGGATKVDDYTFGYYYGPNIPEPTTTTLSLLALAALAARRRRQG